MKCSSAKASRLPVLFWISSKPITILRVRTTCRDCWLLPACSLPLPFLASFFITLLKNGLNLIIGNFYFSVSRPFFRYYLSGWEFLELRQLRKPFRASRRRSLSFRSLLQPAPCW